MSAILYYLELVLGGYIALTIALYTVSLQVPAAGFYARSLASYFGFLISSIYAFVVSIVLRLFGQSRSAQAASGRGIKYVLKYLIGVTFKVEDPNDYLNTVRPAVFIGNHQTELDVLMLGTIFPKYCSVTAKKSLKYIPFLGWFMALSNTVFIDRANAVSARSAMTGAAGEIKRERQSVYIFPEGTRSYAKEPVLLPFKKGAFHLAVQAGVPIVPVVVANYSNVLYVQGRIFKSGEIPVKGKCRSTPSRSVIFLTAGSSKTHRDEDLDIRGCR